MKKKITLIVSALLIAVFSVNAQNSYVNKVIIVNEGHYDYFTGAQTVPVSLGVYDPSTQVYTEVDVIENARFATHVIVDGASIYVAADNQLIRYNANTYKRMATTTVPGIRKLAVWNNQLLVSRGEYLQTFDSYFQVYNKSNLKFLYELPVTSGPKYASEGIIVKGDVAYISINNGFEYGNEVGLIGRVNLAKQRYMSELNLGALGKNPEGMFSDNENIYTVNNTDYTTASVSSISVASQSVITTNLATPTGCGASVLIPGFVMYQVFGDMQIGRFSTSTLTVKDAVKIDKNIYGMATDNINNLIYVGETDYTSYGKIFVFDFSGTLKNSFNVSVAPGNIALDIRSGQGNKGKRIGEENAETASFPALSCFPNPVLDQVTVVTGNENTTDTYILTDITGREVNKIQTSASTFTIDIHTFEPGMYILQSLANPNERVKIVKQ